MEGPLQYIPVLLIPYHLEDLSVICKLRQFSNPLHCLVQVILENLQTCLNNMKESISLRNPQSRPGQFYHIYTCNS